MAGPRSHPLVGEPTDVQRPSSRHGLWGIRLRANAWQIVLGDLPGLQRQPHPQPHALGVAHAGAVKLGAHRLSARLDQGGRVGEARPGWGRLL